MGVIKSKQGLSEMEFYKNAMALRKKMAELLLKDFGIRNKVRKPSSIVDGMSGEDADIVTGILDKYQKTFILDEYPSWFVDKLRTEILNISYSIVMNIVQANSIYPNSSAECQDRRKFQDHAIGNCEQLLQEMQFIISMIPVDANKYMPYVDMIEREIKLLKGWRKSDNRFVKTIREREAKEAAEASRAQDAGNTAGKLQEGAAASND